MSIFSRLFRSARTPSTQTESREIIASLKSDEVSEQYRAIVAINETNNAAVVDALVSCLRSNNSDIRVEATKALGRVGNVAVTGIINLLKDRTWGLDKRVGTVINLLSRTGLKDSEAQILIDMLKQPDMKDLYDGVKSFLGDAIFIKR